MADAAGAPSRLPPLDARLRRSVVALLVSAFCSFMAMGALTIVLGKQVYDLTGSEFDLGLLGLAEFAPSLLLVFVSGPIADRYDRRRVAAIALGIEALFCGALAVYAASDPTSTLPIFLLVIGYGTARAFARPASRSLPADTVPPARLPWLVARQSIAGQAAMIAGPVIAGFLYTTSVTLPLVFVMALMLVGAVSVTFVRTDERDAELRVRADADAAARAELGERNQTDEAPSKSATVHDALEGFRFVRGHQILLGVISLDLFAVLFGGAVALLPAIAEERLGVGAVGLGWLRAAVGIGAALVTLVLTVRPVTRHVGRRMLYSVGVFGVGTVLLGVTTNYAIAWLSLALLSGADAVSVFIRSTLVPLVTPADKRGRVLAIEMVFIGASNELGAFESGVVGQLLGPAVAVVAGGIATIVIAALWASLFPNLRDTDRYPSTADGSHPGREEIEDDGLAGQGITGT
ncbi:MAG: MFS transporter [Acidimicrobiia bacterium]